MALKVLLVQSDPAAAEALFDYFSKRGDRIQKAEQTDQALALLKARDHDLVLLDLHLPGNGWLEFLNAISKQRDKIRLIITNRHPDYRREMLAKERGVKVFLRAPFTPEWIEKALRKFDEKEAPPQAKGTSGVLPRVRLPMRLKITLPYVLLALIFAFSSAFLLSRYILESFQDRFTSQLIDVGKLSSDWIVQEETRLLKTLRLLGNTKGVVEAIQSRDADALREIALPVAINYQEEVVYILDSEGESMLALVHIPGGRLEDYYVTQGGTGLAGLEFIQKILHQNRDGSGNKFAGLLPGKDGDYFTTAGPVLDAQENLVGIIAVGNSLSTLGEQIRKDTLAQITFYGLDGKPLSSTLDLQNGGFPLPERQVANTLQYQEKQSTMRELQVASAKYTEVLGPLEARGGTDLGMIGSALAQNYLARPSSLARVQVFALVLLAFLVVITLGVFLAHQITHPLSQIVAASAEVARGNLEVKVPSRGNDEVMVLAYAFNYMVSGLQEGFIYRDLLGRTVSPEVREALRHSFASGDLRLEGQTATATVLISDIRGFTALSEKEEPTTILNWLNEYFGELVPVITSHGGVVDKFEGDSMLAFFGILPTPLPAQESAYHACQAAVEMLEVIDRINARRMGRGEPPLMTGISINSGTLTAGSLGTSDRLNYTIIGDTVNTTQRMGEVTRAFGESGIVISKKTLDALGGLQGNFCLEPLGQHTFKGKKQNMCLFRLLRSTLNRG